MGADANDRDANELTVDLLVTARQWHELEDLEPLVNRATQAAFAALCQNGAASGALEVAINLSDDATITELNHDFRGQNQPTNVLSFPFENDFPAPLPGPKPLGDIILACETVLREARERDIEPGHHVAHLVVHGLLHLGGYDHISDDEAVEMEGLEEMILARLEIKSPWHNA